MIFFLIYFPTLMQIKLLLYFPTLTNILEQQPQLSSTYSFWSPVSIWSMSLRICHLKECNSVKFFTLKDNLSLSTVLNSISNVLEGNISIQTNYFLHVHLTFLKVTCFPPKFPLYELTSWLNRLSQELTKASLIIDSGINVNPLK